MISNLCALQFVTANNYQTNLDKLTSLIESSPKDSIILAPELCLSGYAYDDMLSASRFTQKAIKTIQSLSTDKTIVLTMVTKSGDKFFNTAYVFHKNKILHKQSKHQLFVLNDERKFFTSGNKNKIKIFEINGIKIAILICFELRFIDLWQKIKGADIILVPSMWGIIRKEHFETLTKALAIANQCYVIASDGANEDLAKGSGIISPFGKENRDDTQEFLCSEFDPKEIKKMRKYMNIGLI